MTVPNNEKQTLLIMFGGMSPEHGVSLNSAAAMAEQVDTDRFDILKIDDIRDSSWETMSCSRPAVISPDRSVHGVICGDETYHVDCVFPMFHGECGEDGTIQGLFEIAGLPYVGCGVAASACSMDKGLTKVIVEHAGIRQAAYVETDRSSFRKDPESVLDKVEKGLYGTWPLFVKPALSGAAGGRCEVPARGELMEGLKTAFGHGPKVLVEETISGREFEIAVLGNEEPETAPVGEVISGNEFYDFEAKYSTTLQKTGIVTDVSAEKLDVFRENAVTIYKALGCRGMSRVDFFYEDGTGDLVFNEINTLPGFTPTSMYPQMWAANGLEYPELITKLVELAMEEK